MTPEMKKECWEIINQYLKIVSEERKTNRTSNVLACEKNFEFEVRDNIILNGMIDRVQVDDDNMLHIIDYKSTKNKKYLQDDWFQLMTYGYAMYLENPDLKKIRVSYMLLKHNFENLTKEFDIDELIEVKDKYIKYAEDILSEKEFAANPSFLCDYCDHNRICKDKQVNPTKIYGKVDW